MCVAACSSGHRDSARLDSEFHNMLDTPRRTHGPPVLVRPLLLPAVKEPMATWMIKRRHTIKIRGYHTISTLYHLYSKTVCSLQHVSPSILFSWGNGRLSIATVYIPSSFYCKWTNQCSNSLSDRVPSAMIIQ